MSTRGDGPPQDGTETPLGTPFSEFDDLPAVTTQVTDLRSKPNEPRLEEGLLLTLTHDGGIEACVIKPGKPYLLGRVRPADICVPDPSLSRTHARIHLTEDEEGLIVEDLRSTNGIYREKEKIERAILVPGGVLRAGNVFLRVSHTRLVGQDPKRSGEPGKEEAALATGEHLEAVNHMVTGVAHEINTPLGIINNATSFLTDGLRSEALEGLAINASARETLSDLAEAGRLIQRNAARLDKLVSSFKHLSAQQFAEERCEVDLPRTLREAITAYGLAGESRGGLRIHLEDLRRGPERRWLGYPGRLTKVLHNLLSNAERYAYPKSEGPVEVSLADRGEAGFTLVVRDRGRGIPQQDLGKVFNPFFTTGRSFGATGLGLTVARNLVCASMQGEIRIGSEPGAGTWVTVELPWVAPGAVSVES